MKKFLIALPFILLVTSCTSYANYYALDSNYLQRRQMETRRFETDNEDAMLVASSQVLQDLGFTLETSETKLGLLTASKNREASSTAKKVGLNLLAAYFGTTATYDQAQKIYAMLVSTKSRESSGFNVRIGFSRIIVKNDGRARTEIIRDPEIYREFFDKLSQSLFLTANNL
jgi:hypothetical protein